MIPDAARFRTLAAILTTLSGIGQCSALWFLPTSKTLLLTALLGSLYLLLALGLFGISRFSIVLALSLLPLRAWSGLYPLEITTWETLRTVVDVAVAVICIPVLWVMLDHRHEKIAPGLRAGAEPSLEEDDA